MKMPIPTWMIQPAWGQGQGHGDKTTRTEMSIREPSPWRKHSLSVPPTRAHSGPAHVPGPKPRSRGGTWAPEQVTLTGKSAHFSTVWSWW